MKFLNEWDLFKDYCKQNDISCEVVESNGVAFFIEAEADYGRDAWIQLLKIMGYEEPPRIPSYD